MNCKSQLLQPLVSICIPTYNAAKYIVETLESISRQTYKNIEIIVGDNASSDDTERLVDDFKKTSGLEIIYYKNENNLGYSGNCNKLIKQAKGEFVAIYHSDDIYHDRIVEHQVSLLLENKEVAGCFTNYSYIDEKGNDTTRGCQFEVNNSWMTIFNHDDYIVNILDKFRNPFFCPSSLVRKDIYQTVGGYNERIKFIEDQDMWIRILENNSMAVINKKLVKYRIHEAQGSSVYTNINRKSESPMISHIRSYLLEKYGEERYTISYKFKVDRLLAIDDIRFAFYLVKKGCNQPIYSKYHEFIRCSKAKYLLSVSDIRFVKFFVLQWLPVSITYLALKLVIKVRS
ncbi:glycosyltransferase [Vibrio ouci]|uniref:Glycosyltransferase n=1 Tax=Vibrio ouci TaxID=2499078 RepID=A0A4Y8WK66_9VIBR|nr:glycosyltransferase [Vibrio ouci]TFH92995.1 glycosyltransferase [Vibrio ouci]